MMLYICEKPAQARDIAKHLKATNRHNGYLEGNGSQVTWCIGHLLHLAPPEYYRPDLKPWHIDKLPVIPQQWHKIIAPKTQKQFYVIQQLLKKINHVVIASDPDRAGEGIVREILEHCHYQGTIERLWLSALDDTSIQKALKNLKPGHATQALYAAETARSQADWLLGMNATIAASSLYGVNSVLSLGRVQTPTLKLVVERDILIEHFKPQAYFTLKIQCRGDANEPFWAHWQAPKESLDAQGHCTQRAILETIAAQVDGEPATMTAMEQTQKKHAAPLCLSLSALQKKASQLWGYSAQQTLNLAQTLYEKHKAITYPRTDCAYLPCDQFQEVPQILTHLAGFDASLQPLIQHCDATFKSAVWNDKKITAHHAIIPTLNPQINLSAFSTEAFNLYDLIRRHYLAQLMGDYHYQITTLTIQCAGEIFKACGTLPMQLGWKKAFKPTLHANPQTPEATLPTCAVGEILKHPATQLETHQTQAPAYFTEGTLIDAMKNVGKHLDEAPFKKILNDSQGIGTEATRAGMLETLFKRGFLKRHNKQVQATAKGRALIEIAPSSLKNPILTAQWETKLSQIAEGKFSTHAFMKAQVEALPAMLTELKNSQHQHPRAVLQLQSETQTNTVYLCPTCQAPLRRLNSNAGKIFWGCSRYPNCGFTCGESQGKPRD